MAHLDIEQHELGELKWQSDDRAESLTTVYRHAIDSAREVETWYAKKRRMKRPWGRALRGGAILLVGLAAILPVVAQIFGDGGGAIAPGWATVALAAAAILIALDRFFGFSSAWMRFMEADLHVKQLRHDFEYAWQEAQVTQSDPPTDAEVVALLALARAFATAVDAGVAKETGVWATEFRSILEKIERDAERSARG